MSHFAQIDENNIVTQVIVAEQDFIDSGLVGDPTKWLRTSYNTHGGIYYTPNTNTPDPDQSKAFRKNYAGEGFFYDSVLDGFIPPKPYPSWLLNTISCMWEPPVPYPTDGKKYTWDEATQSWVLVDGQ